MNSNGRVIGSIVKKRRKKEGKTGVRGTWREGVGRRGEDEMGSKMKGARGGRGLGCRHNFLSRNRFVSSKNDIVNMQRSFGKMGWRGRNKNITA